MERVYDERWDIVIEYLPMIEKMARIYSSPTFGYGDLYQEACLAVYENILDYDESRGMPISSFLMERIRYHFFSFFATNKFEAFVPTSYCIKSHNLQSLQQKSYLMNGKYLTNKEAAERLKYSEVTVEVLEKLNLQMPRSKSLSLEVYDGYDEMEASSCDYLIESIVNSLISDIDVSEEAIAHSLCEDILKELYQLPEKNRLSILYRLGFITGKVETFPDIGKLIGGTKQNAQQHYNRGIKILKKSFLEESKNSD